MGRKKRIVLAIVVFVVACVGGYLVVTHPFFGDDSPRKRAESALRDNLFTLRSLIQQYEVDKGTPPQSLNDLVTSGYLKRIPEDPMTGRNDTWIISSSTEPGDGGVVNVSSGSKALSTDGSPYCEW